ncbi:MAG: hypothetical protein R6X33_05590 [Candidatus Brocadiia bacterium]
MSGHATDWKPLWLADLVRFGVEMIVWAGSLVPAGVVFVLLWSTGDTVWRMAAFPAAFGGFLLGFLMTLFLLEILLLRRVTPGRYVLTDPGARRWLVADSFMRMYRRHFLHRLVDDLAPLRYVFYRLAGADVDASFFLGWDARMLDAWGLKVGRNVIIGSFAVISCHLVEGDELRLAPVEIADGATIGVRSTILPGVTVGEGAIVGAGALVLEDTHIKANEVWVGVPARKVGMAGETAEAAALCDGARQ